MRGIGLGAAGLCLLLGACASVDEPNYSLSPANNGKVAARFDRGVPTLVSQGGVSVLQIMPVPSTDGHRMVLGLAALNRSGRPYNLGYENVRLAYEDGTPLRTYTADDLRREARSEAAWATFGAQFLSALRSAAAEDAARTYTSTAVSSRYYAATSGRFGTIRTGAAASTLIRSESYDGRLAYALQRENAIQTAADLRSISESLSRRLSMVEADSLRTTTIDPDSTGVGVVVIGEPAFKSTGLRRIKVSVRFAGEDHEFLLDAVRRGTAGPSVADMPALTRASIARITGASEQPNGTISSTELAAARPVQPIPSQGVATASTSPNAARREGRVTVLKVLTDGSVETN